MLHTLCSPCDGREGCGARLGLLGAVGSPWVGEGQGLLRGEGRGEDPGPEPAPGCRCCGRISSTSSSTSPGTGDKRAGINLLDSGNPYSLPYVVNINWHLQSTFLRKRIRIPHLPYRNHRRPCLCPQQVEWSWLRWGCFHRSALRSSPPPDS